jgi:vitamin B12 transporter
MFDSSAPRAAAGFSCRRALFCLSLSFLSNVTLGQSPESVDPDTVVVTASRAPQPAASVLGDISVVDRAQIERAGAVGVADLLARLPGIEFARNGGPGTTTSVFIRGGETRHTAVYIDGARVDSQSTGGAVWEQIPLEQIDRIEILRGPAAAAYGSDAVAGVIQLFTRRGSGATRPSVSVTSGSYGTRQVQAGLSGATGVVDFALSGSYGEADGFSARTLATSNPDDDGWRRESLHARAGVRLNDQHRIEASLLASDLRSQYDGSATANDISKHTLRSANVAWEGAWTESATTRLQAGQTESTYETRPSFYRTETTLRNYLLQHEQRFGDQVVTAILERREDELLNPATAFAATLENERHQDALNLGWRGEFGAHSFQLQARRDKDSEFGGKSTGSAAWGWTFLDGWRVNASVASSFRVPTLFQRFSQYGNPGLVPESGRNTEVGLRWSDGPMEASVTAWRNNISNLINFGPPGPCVDSFGCYVNVGRARLEGVTLAARASFAAMTLRGSIDWHDPRNLNLDRVLQRRAKRFASLGAETTWLGWTLGTEVQASGERFENAANTQRLGGYTLINVFVARTLLPGLVLEGRLDNVTDKDYQLARTYATPGRAGQLTVRWTMP